jgi:ATP-binding cassette subfamily B protein IrtA
VARGWQGTYYKVFGVDDHELTVTAVEDISPRYRRIRFASDTLLSGFDPQPATWVRLWIPDPADAEREVQRAYTFVDADAARGTFALDFVLHEPAGPASAWASAARPGTTVRALIYGASKFEVPAIEPTGFLLVGDPASIPGLRSVVDAIPERFPVELYLEQFHDDDRDVPLPTHPRLRITWVPHRAGGHALADAIERRDWSDWYVWGGAEKAAIRELRATLHGELGFPKSDVKLTVYWIDGKPMGGKSRGTPELAPGRAVEPEPAPELLPASEPERDPERDTTEPRPVAAEATAHARERRWRSQAGSELLAPVQGALRVAMVVQAVVTLLELAPFVLLVEAGHRMLDGQTPEQLRSLVTWALVILGIAATATAALLLWLHVVDARFSTELKRRIVAKLARLPLGWFTDASSGTVRNLVIDDTANLHYLVTHAVLDLVAAIVAPVAVLLYLFVVDARFAAILLIPLVAYGIVLGRMISGSTAAIAEHQRWTTRVSGEAISFLEGAAVVRTYGDDGASRLRETLQGYTAFIDGWQGPLGTKKAVAAMITRPSTFTWVIATAGTALLTLGTLSAATLVTFLVLGVTFGPKLLSAAYGAAAYRESTAAAQRIGLALSAPDLVTVPDRPASGPTLVGPPVSFRDVTFSYRAGQPVLRDIDLDLPGGQVTALVGPSGAGKSTLGALLARFHDVDDGVVTIDGRDLRSFAPEEQHQVVGFVFQDVRLVHGTVRDNIALARPDASDHEVRQAAAAAAIADRIERLPAGYDTVVGTDVRFSGGEAQRISIARTLLADPPVLVLDEATAFADPESERQVQDALSTLARGRTVLVIAHRLHTIVDAAQIVVLDGGRIVERGRHDELLARGGTYTTLWSHARGRLVS